MIERLFVWLWWQPYVAVGAATTVAVSWYTARERWSDSAESVIVALISGLAWPFTWLYWTGSAGHALSTQISRWVGQKLRQRKYRIKQAERERQRLLETPVDTLIEKAERGS